MVDPECPEIQNWKRRAQSARWKGGEQRSLHACNLAGSRQGAGELHAAPE